MQDPPTEADEELDTLDIGKELERVKWFLWHGNAVRALDTIEDIEAELDFLPQKGESRRKLLKAVREFRAISKRTRISSQIMAIVTGTERRFQRASRSPLSIKW
jgi:hypothetical protein